MANEVHQCDGCGSKQSCLRTRRSWTVLLRHFAFGTHLFLWHLANGTETLLNLGLFIAPSDGDSIVLYELLFSETLAAAAMLQSIDLATKMAEPAKS